MPKPTTHTDIVVVSKTDPADPANGRVTESVQITLTTDAAPSATDMQNRPLVEAHAGTHGIDSELVAMGMTASNRRLELGYHVEIAFGPLVTYCKIQNEPKGWGNEVSPKKLTTHSWVHPTPEKSVIAQLKLVLYGELADAGLTTESSHSTSGGLTQLKLDFKDSANKVVGTLVLSASMEAQHTV